MAKWERDIEERGREEGEEGGRGGERERLSGGRDWAVREGVGGREREGEGNLHADHQHAQIGNARKRWQRGKCSQCIRT